MPSPLTIAQQIKKHLYRQLLITWLLTASLAILVWFIYFRVDQAYSAVLISAQQLQTASFDLDNHLLAEMLETRAYLLGGDPGALDRRTSARQGFLDDLDKISAQGASGLKLDLASLPILRKQHATFDSLVERVISQRQAGQGEQLLAIFDARSDPLMRDMQGANQDLQREAGNNLVAISERFAQSTNLMIIVVCVLFLAGAILSGILILLFISGPLKTMDYLENSMLIAAQNRTYQPLALDGVPVDTARLITSYNQLVNQLKDSTNSFLKYVSFLHHEIHSVLTSVSGYGYILSDKSLQLEATDPTEFGRVIVKQTRRATSLVEDFTLAVRLEAHQYMPEMMPLYLTPLLNIIVTEMLDECRVDEPQREITFIHPEKPIIVLGNSISLDNAFRKLIDNALHFSRADTPVRVTVELSGTTNSVLVHIQDHGIGIEARDLPMLFQPFFRVKLGLPWPIPGNGLGLYLANSIVELHHGQIDVESQPGNGSVFTIILPLEA